LKKDPNHIKALLLKAEVFNKFYKNPKKARELVTRAIELEPNHPKIRSMIRGRQDRDTNSIKKKEFPPLLTIALVLNSVLKSVSDGKRDEDLSSYVRMLSLKELIELQIDFVSIYHAVLDHYSISQVIKEIEEIAKRLMGYSRNDAEAFDIFNTGLKKQSVSLIKKAADLAPRNLMILKEILDFYIQRGRTAKFGDFFKKFQVINNELRNPQEVYDRITLSYNSIMKNWKEERLFFQFTHNEDIFTQMIMLTSDINKWLKGEKNLLSPQELILGVKDCQICFEWMSVLASLAYYKLTNDFSEEAFVSPLKDSIETVLGFVPVPLSSIQTPTFLSPAHRKKKWMDIMGTDIFTLRLMTSIKEAKFVHIDGDLGNDDPESHAWFSKEHSIDNKGDIFVKSGNSEIDAIIAHIETYFGKTDKILHDTKQDRLHIDTYLMPPTKERNYSLMITSGMSQRPMNSPSDKKDAQFAELFFYLPPEWPLPLEKLIEDDHSWAIQNLYEFAHFVHDRNTFFWHSQVIDLHRPLSKDTKMTGFIIAHPLGVPEEFGTLELDSGKKIYFLQLIPAYNDEMDYLEHNGWEALFKKFQENGVTGIVNLHRKNACEREIDTNIAYETYENQDLGFTIDYPNTWLVDARPGILRVVFVEKKNSMSGQFSMIASISIASVKMSEAEFRNSLSSMEKKFSVAIEDFTIVEPASVFEANFPCHYLVGKGYKEKFFIQASLYEALHNNVVYLASFAVDVNHAMEKRQIIDRMMKSLQFDPKRSIPTNEVNKMIEDSMQSLKAQGLKKDERFQTIDATLLRRGIENLTAKSSIEEVDDIINAFSYASISVDLKGFGEVSHLLSPFLKKLKSVGLYSKLPEDTIYTLSMFEKIVKEQNI
jgi:hypothetical protein